MTITSSIRVKPPAREGDDDLDSDFGIVPTPRFRAFARNLSTRKHTEAGAQRHPVRSSCALATKRPETQKSAGPKTGTRSPNALSAIA
jgi:hypothetical protein